MRTESREGYSAIDRQVRQRDEKHEVEPRLSSTLEHPAGTGFSELIMGNNFGRKDLIPLIAAKRGISEAKSRQVLEVLLDAVKNALARGQRIELRKFGVFTMVPRKITKGRNPSTGEQIKVQPGKVVKFKPSKSLLALRSVPNGTNKE